MDWIAFFIAIGATGVVSFIVGWVVGFAMGTKE